MKENKSEPQKLKLNQGFITQKVDGQVTVFSGEESILYTFNDTGALILQGLKLGWDDEKIIKSISTKFKVSAGDAEKDIADFKKTLLSKKILISADTE